VKKNPPTTNFIKFYEGWLQNDSSKTTPFLIETLISVVPRHTSGHWKNRNSASPFPPPFNSSGRSSSIQPCLVLDEEPSTRVIGQYFHAAGRHTWKILDSGKKVKPPFDNFVR
jgi:hypothetical protein